MRELKAVRDIGNVDVSISASKVLAFFANISDGLSLGHIPFRDVEWVCEQIVDECVEVMLASGAGHKLASDFSDLTVDQLAKVISDVMQRQDNSHFFVRRVPLACHADCIAVTFQPSWAFGFWLDHAKVPEAKITDHGHADVVALCNEFRNPANRKTNARIGMRFDAIWLAPFAEHLRAETEAALALLPGEREAKRTASPLRNLLGLSSRKPGEHAVLGFCMDTLGVMAAQRDAKVATPTVLDSRGYARFWYWPPSGGAEDGFGRTFQLDSRTRAVNGDRGAKEIVRKPLALDAVERFEYVGAIGPNDEEDDPVNAIGAHRRFAMKLSQGRTIVQVIDQLIGDLGV